MASVSASGSSDEVVNTRDSRWKIRPSIWIVAITAVAFIIKAYIAWTTLGTNDVTSFHQFAKALTEHGIEWTYRHDTSFNHPPLTAYFLRGIYSLDNQPFCRQYGITFPFLLRLPGIVADFVVILILLGLQYSKPNLRLPTWVLAIMAINPVSIMISGFHGNTDPVMVMLLFIASVMLLRAKPILCGLFLAL